MKLCTSCKTYKDVQDFNKDISKSDGLRPDCKECRKSYMKLYRNSNKKSLSDYFQQYRAKEKESLRLIHSKSIKKRRNENPIFKLKSKLSIRIRDALTGREVYTCKSQMFDIVGLDGIELIKYLKETFQSRYHLKADEIGLENIQVDHIVPLSTAGTQEEVFKLNHYTNLQLLYKEDNKLKGISHE